MFAGAWCIVLVLGYNAGMMRAELLHNLLQVEETIQYYQVAPVGEVPFVHEVGEIPVLISAPHATAHRRRGRMKGEEEFTAALAVLLGRQTGAHVLYTRYRSEADPNWDREAPYKLMLRRIVAQYGIRFVLDVHGMSNRYKIGMALGTMNGRSCPQRESLIADAWLAHRFQSTTERASRTFSDLKWDHFVVNHSRFTGGVINHTVTRFVTESLGIGAAQIELCSTVRVVQRGRFGKNPGSFRGDPHGIMRAFQALTATVNAVG